MKTPSRVRMTGPDNLGMLAEARNPRLYICRASGNKVGSMANVMDWMDYVYVEGRQASDDGGLVVMYCPPGHHGAEGDIRSAY